MSNPVYYYSTNLKAKPVTFREALLQGMAPDKGLYMPESIPQISLEEIYSYTDLSYFELAFNVMWKFLNTELPKEDFYKIVKESYDFNIPIESVYENKFIMRLDQGPTASFKDFAARVMGRLMNYYLSINNKKLIILTATSGDTGSAVANAFYELDKIKVVILYPEKEITEMQRRQMTTLGKNIEIIAINGKFDDCQALVKQAFSDTELEYLNLSSANSINIGRLLPQAVYYFYAFVKLYKETKSEDIIFSVPSGNFGNMLGGTLAMKMGLPVKKYIIAVNENDEFPVLLKTHKYRKIQPSRNCISSAMNVGHPSNLARLISLYNGVMDEKGNIISSPDYELMNKDFFSVSISDEYTRKTIKEVWEKYSVLIEPHGAVAWAGLQEYLKENPNSEQLFVSVETAHPAKFPEEIEKILGFRVKFPESLKNLENKKEYYIIMDNKYNAFKNFLIENC